MLLSEEMEMPSTPQLPASRILKEELRKAAGKQNFLWEGSALTGAWAVESFYTANLVPPIVPQQPTKVSPAPPVTHADAWGTGGRSSTNAGQHTGRRGGEGAHPCFPSVAPECLSQERPLMSRTDHASSECGWHEASEEGPRNLHSKCVFQTILQVGLGESLLPEAPGFLQRSNRHGLTSQSSTVTFGPPRGPAPVWRLMLYSSRSHPDLPAGASPATDT